MKIGRWKVSGGFCRIRMKKSKQMEKLIITPKTKIYDLLESYPHLEEVLIATAPQFKKLKNPVLRKTITKITTLSQAAVVGGVKVEELINKLRKEVGQAAVDALVIDGGNYVTEKPLWFDARHVTQSIDIREMLNAGEQPVHEVLAAIRRLGDGEILKVTSPFIPAPLIDKTLSLNYQHWLEKVGDEVFYVYFRV